MYNTVLAGTEALKLNKTELLGAKLFKKIKPTAIALDDDIKKSAEFTGETIWVDGTQFWVFKHARNYLLTMKQGTREAKQRIDTIEAACRFISDDAVSFNCWYMYDDGFYNRKLDAIADYHSHDTRVCLYIDCCRHCTYLDVVELTGYNADKHCWTEETIKYKTRIETKRGQKQLVDLQFKIAEMGGPAYTNNQKFSATRKNGKLTVI